jgi:hypothetical protein
MLVESALAAFEGGSVASKGDISHAHQAKNGHKMHISDETSSFWTDSATGKYSTDRADAGDVAAAEKAEFFNLGFFGCGNVASISSVSTVLPGRGVGPEARGPCARSSPGARG